jgi:Zn ribbon nucleic-acid-binding protein
MEEDDKIEIPECLMCGSHQIRTTKNYRVCIRCGNREKI